MIAHIFDETTELSISEDELHPMKGGEPRYATPPTKSRPAHLRPNSFSTTSIASFTQVGRPWLLWPECGGHYIWRRSEFISAKDRVQTARCATLPAVMPHGGRGG